MAREGMFDDSGYHDFDECSRYEDCCKSAYEQGRNDAIDEFVSKFKEIDDCEFAMYSLCLIEEIAEKLKGADNDKSRT